MARTEAQRKSAAAAQARWRAKNPERVKAMNDERRDSGKRAAYYAANRDRVLVQKAAWRAANARTEAASAAVNQANQRARRIGVAVSDLTLAQWLVILAEHGDRCAYCGTGATEMDHVIALSAGGMNTAANVVPSCRDCNVRKAARPLAMFLRAQS